MTISAEALRKLHRLHRQANDLRDRLAHGPKVLKARQANVKRLEEELGTVKEKLKRTRITVDQKELSLKERENRILDIRAKLNSCSSNREYQAFMEQIAADEQANSVLSDEILELLDKVNEEKDLVQTSERNIEDAQAQFKTHKEKVQSERGTLENELARVESELRHAEQELPSEIKQDYERVVKAHGEEALAPLEGECCGGCYQRITAQMISDLSLSRAVFCKSCGRLLYLPDDAKVS